MRGIHWRMEFVIEISVKKKSYIYSSYLLLTSIIVFLQWPQPAVCHGWVGQYSHKQYHCFSWVCGLICSLLHQCSAYCFVHVQQWYTRGYPSPWKNIQHRRQMRWTGASIQWKTKAVQRHLNMSSIEVTWVTPNSNYIVLNIVVACDLIALTCSTCSQCSCPWDTEVGR